MTKHSLSFSSCRAWAGLALLAAASAFVTVACGGSSSDGGNGSDSSSTAPSGSGGAGGGAGGGCAGTTRALCKKACACTSNGTGKCAITYGGSVTETHDSEADCTNFYTVMVCGDATNAAQYDDACGAAVEGAQCTTASTSEPAVDFPTAGCPKKK